MPNALDLALDTPLSYFTTNYFTTNYFTTDSANRSSARSKPPTLTNRETTVSISHTILNVSMYSRDMAGIERVTQPTLDVLEALLDASQRDEELHGWAIISATKRAGPTVYRALDRLVEAGLVTRRWEELEPDQSGPRRRYYRLTGEGIPAARALLVERRPSALRPSTAFSFAPLVWMRSLAAGGAR
ncbi:PadR family transcriptional regulator [Streptosporangium canum]|uniref:PadR family transcriptional regulator n=1 Tax=Streptosporangium canum TaxID=324952 RepID=UPI0036C89D20